MNGNDIHLFLFFHDLKIPEPDINLRISGGSHSEQTGRALARIERAIKKGEGNDLDSNYEEIRYEGYGPDGVAIIVEVMTNNKNRTAAEIRSTFGKYGGNLGESGSVSYNFKRIGRINLDKTLAKEDEIFEFLVENGSEDFTVNEEDYVIDCEQSILHILNELSLDVLVVDTKK